MAVKDAATNSLLMFVVATCVVLVVKAVPPTRSLSQAVADNASSATVGDSSGAPVSSMRNGVIVYYLHGNTRCPTCRTIEAYAKEAVESGFADELQAGRIQWKVVNYETPGNEHFATDYETVAPNLVLVKFEDGKQVAWKGLPEVWEHAGDKAAFLNFVQTNLRQFLEGKESETPTISVLPTAPAEASSDTLPLPE